MTIIALMVFIVLVAPVSLRVVVVKVVAIVVPTI